MRSLGQIVAPGKPFVWLPDQMPFFGCDGGAIQLSADMERVIFADKGDDHVPIFTEVMQFDSTSTFGRPAAEGESAPAEPQPLPAPAPAGSSTEDAGEPLSEDGDEDPKDRYARLVRDANSLERKRLHIPKNPACEVCQRSRMYRRRINSKSHDPLESRGMLEETIAFGERLACDFIVSKAPRSGQGCSCRS